MNKLIWYDGTRKRYCVGTIEDLEGEMKSGKKKSIHVIYELDNASDHLVSKILQSLNSVKHLNH